MMKSNIVVIGILSAILAVLVVMIYRKWTGEWARDTTHVEIVRKRTHSMLYTLAGLVCAGAALQLLEPKNYSGSVIFSVAVAAVLGRFFYQRGMRRQQEADQEEKTPLRMEEAGHQDKTTPRTDEKRCLSCGTPYNLDDYRPDAEHIFCAGCQSELPRT